MKKYVKPVIAFKEDIDAWIYYDQLSNVLRYEIYCIGYNSFGEPTTLDFVIEEGILNSQIYKDILVKESPSYSLPWIQLDDYFLLLKDSINSDIGIPHEQFTKYEVNFKTQSKKRIIRKLKALGYEVLPSLEN